MEQNKTTTICSHTIEYWWENNDADWDGELSETDEEYIRKLLNEDYLCGELCTCPPDIENEVYGWWKINYN